MADFISWRSSPNASREPINSQVLRDAESQSSKAANEPTARATDIPITDPVNELLNKFSGDLPSSPLLSTKKSPKARKRGRSFSGRSPVAPAQRTRTEVPETSDDISFGELLENFGVDTSNTSMQDTSEAVSRRSVPNTPQKNSVLAAPQSSPNLLDIEDLGPLTPAFKYVPIDFRNRRSHRYVVQSSSAAGTFECTTSDDRTITLILRDSWIGADVRAGNHVHVIGLLKDDDGIVEVSHSNNRLLIVEPDTLITITNVATALECERQVALTKYVRPPSEVTKPLLYGTITHEFIQQCFLVKDFSIEFMRQALNDTVEHYVDELSLLDMTSDEAVSELSGKLSTIQQWSQKYLKEGGRTVPNVPVAAHRGRLTIAMALERVVDVEEEIRSPFLGLRGRIDATVEVSTADGEIMLAPLEIKTGKRETSAAHRAQAMLYTLLMREQHPGNAHPWSLLWYADIGTMIAVDPSSLELRQLVQKRNSLVRAVSGANVTPLPPPTTQIQTCQFCAFQSACSTYTQSAGETHEAVTDTYPVDDLALKFFEKWDNLITLESLQEPFHQTSPWWTNLNVPRYTLDAAEESLGEYVLRIVDGIQHEDIFPGTRVILSTPHHLGIARGYCLQPETPPSGCIKIRCDRPLLRSSKYRVDIEAFDAVTPMARYNLVHLVATPELTLRDLVVRLREPRFIDSHSDMPIKGLNEDQAHAIRLVERAEDYALIRGMPGTGKTTTTVSIIQLMLSRGQSVLVTGYTHSAVDNIAAKLISLGTSVLRLGSSDKVHPLVRPSLKFDGVPQVVACTALGITDPYFSTREAFDWCIVDEASQISLPVCLGPLRLARRFVLVGDHYQLPPLVRSLDAKSGGLDQSLFKILCEKYPNASASLTRQYRMCEDVMLLSSRLVYGNGLICGSSDVAEQKLGIELSDTVQGWLRDALNPRNRVVFLNTDTVDRATQEIAQADGSSNPVEADIVHKITTNLLEAGVSGKDIGVISVYRAQIQLLRTRLPPDVEVLTADQSQGRDMDVVIVSLVRSNTRSRTGLLLRDWRRLNVAFTRARCKLIIVGSRGTLLGGTALHPYIELIEQRGWLRNVY